MVYQFISITHLPALSPQMLKVCAILIFAAMEDATTAVLDRKTRALALTVQAPLPRVKCSYFSHYGTGNVKLLIFFYFHFLCFFFIYLYFYVAGASE